MLIERADVWRAGSAGGGSLSARALPAAEASEHVRERRQRVVGGRLLLVVDHQQALGLEAEPRRHRTDRVLDVLLGGVLAAFVGMLGLLREDAGRGPASPRAGLGRGPRAAW